MAQTVPVSLATQVHQSLSCISIMCIGCSYWLKRTTFGGKHIEDIYIPCAIFQESSMSLTGQVCCRRVESILMLKGRDLNQS